MKLEKQDIRFFAIAAAAAVLIALILAPVLLATQFGGDRMHGYSRTITKHRPDPITERPSLITELMAQATPIPARTPAPSKTAQSNSVNIVNTSACNTGRCTAARPCGQNGCGGNSGARFTSVSSRPAPSSAQRSCTTCRKAGTACSSPDFCAQARAEQKLIIESWENQYTYWQDDIQRIRRHKKHKELANATKQLNQAKAELDLARSPGFLQTLVKRMVRKEQQRQIELVQTRKDAAIRTQARQAARRAKIYREEFEKVGL